MIRAGLPLLLAVRDAQEAYQGRGPRLGQPPGRDRESHAGALLRALDELPGPSVDRAPGSDGTLIVATGSTDFAEVASRLGDKSSEAEVVTTSGDSAVVHLRTDARALRRKIEDYRDAETRKGRPKNEPLIARIDSIRLPTLRDLSLGEIDPADLDPALPYWVELWTRGGSTESADTRTRVAEEVRWLAVLGGQESIPPRFPGVERDIYLTRLSGEVLRELPVLLPEVYEVHLAPRVRLVESIIRTERSAQRPLPVDPPPVDAAAVAVHDTGTSSTHPYLAPTLLGTHSSVPGEVDPDDRHGHGTEMSGVAVYSQYLSQVAAGRLTAENYLVGVRLIPTPHVGPANDDPELWAERTLDSIAVAEGLAGDRPVIHNLSVGAENESGVRTSWSIGVDRAAWNDARGRLVVVAAGNLPPDRLAVDAQEYPVGNLGTPMCQPAQAWNAITVGGYTGLTGPPAEGGGAYPDALAPVGALSPYAATDVGGNRPIKPDVVEEAGNTAPGGGLPNAGGEHLSIWTTSHRHNVGHLSTQTWATSPAAAATSASLAIITREQPRLGSAAIRGLYVNTARWTPAMDQQFPDKRDKLRAVGYGLPDGRKAARGADSNRPVFLYEGELAPAKTSVNGVAARPIQFIRVALPDELIASVAELPVRLAVTLSYFVEPTESGAGRNYAGGRLRWEMQGPAETEDGLRRRVNALAREASSQSGGSSGYDWAVGVNARSRGSLQHDYTNISAGQLAGDRLVAVYPVIGWWEQRQSTQDRSIPFALVISVDFGEADVDVYNAIASSVSTVVMT